MLKNRKLFSSGQKNNIFFVSLLVFIVVFSFLGADFVNAAGPVGVSTIVESAPTTEATLEKGQAEKSTWDNFVDAMKTAGSKAFGSALTNALNTIAYDTATWLGSGSEGQKPKFITEGWGTYLSNVADNAAGTFIEGLGKNGFTSFNLCEPDLDVKLKISLGLTQYEKPDEPKCSFSKIKQNWENEIDRWKDMERADYLKDFQDMFEPASNDIGAAFTLHTGIFEAISSSTNSAEKDRTEGGGWLEFDSVSGIREAYPNNAKMQAEMSNRLMAANLAVWTGDALVDAGNIFLNQLAITAFQTQLKKLLSEPESYTSSYSGDYGLDDMERQASSGGVSAIKDRLKGIIQPNFTVRGDYNIISELSLCPDSSKAGPTNCVINDKLSRAITNKLTVAEAVDQGYLNAGGIFGFHNKVEPSYTEGYPYRSMIILRKFRILPVGWEVAAQYIYENGGSSIYSLGDLVGCFSADDNFKGKLDADWCRGLVDPNWVLKAPLNYCRRSGPGPEIINSTVAGEGQNSKLMVLRNDNYCADEQSCIDENDDGSCRFFGYCVEEKRKWNFDGDSCEAKFNSCQTFRSSEGDTISYLKNTLDYGACSVDNVGCREYCTDFDYANGIWGCSETSGNKIYFDNNVEECDQENEGCHEFIRTKPGLGTNLIENSSFENDIAGDVWADVGEQTGGGYEGVRSLKLNTDLDKYFAVGPSGYSIVGRSYSLSFYAKDCGESGEFGLGTNLESKTLALSTNGSWKKFNISYVFPNYYTDNKVRVIIRNFGSTCTIDGIKLENNKTATAYTDYGYSGLVYEKLLPDYLAGTCYSSNSDFRLKNNAPAECGDFARKCNQEEVGCEMFTSVRDKTDIPAQVVEDNYCPGECVGYDEYVQSGTTFDSQRSSYFIPKSARTCTAQATGCDEFTNLDEVARGGEGTEYYTYLRQCVKSDDSSCAEFYTWEGSDEAGYQLKVFKLKADGDQPFVTEDDSTMCNASIYSLAASDPSYNEDCREFYSKNGTISYHLYTRTVTCSDDCHTYRRTAVNTDPDILNSSECSSAGGQWTNGECSICKNNGRWDAQQGACLYDAIPGEGATCSATQNGCRKYVGNFGNNIRTVLNYYFEGSAQGWSASEGSNIQLSGESLSVGGESLYVSGTSNSAFATVGNLVQTNKAYALNFIIKPNTASKIKSISFVNSLGQKDEFSSVDLGNDWQFYKVNISNVNNKVDANEKLVISADGSFYIDDIELTEINDQYYLIKNSWTTPDSCDQDSSGYPSPLYMLGCAEYRDRDNVQHYLRSFNNLCQESAVGCELLVDTNNSKNYKSETFNKGDVSEVTVPEDKFVYAVYDKDKECFQEDKGCERMGGLYKYENNSLYSDIYLLNNPDQYNESLCTKDEVGCQAWTSDATNYFKDPGDQVCEWRLAYQGDWGWYKKKVKRCDDNKDGSGEGSVCVNNESCADSVDCKLETNDIPCPTKADKTFGTGNEKIYQPSRDADGNSWAGVCAAEDSGCTEYIDPVSRFTTNIIANADFSIDNEAPVGQADGWNNQTISLYPNTLYSLSVEGDNGVTISGSTLVFYELGQDNKLSVVPTNSITVSSLGERNSKIFYTSDSSMERNATVSVDKINTNNGSVISLREVVVDYQIKQKLDKTSCNGLVDFENGCVLFNERSYSGSSLSKLLWDADLSIKDNNGVSPSSGDSQNRDSNTILKVRPDRECDKWMACVKEETGIVDGEPAPVCIDVGLCDRIDENGKCTRFVDNKKVNETYYPDNNNANQFSNRSGYSKVGLEYSADKTISLWPNNLYPFGFMDPKGEVVSITNSGFEFAYDADSSPTYDSTTGQMVSQGSYGDYGDDDLPEYWTTVYNCSGECKPEIVDDPVEAAQERVCFTENDSGCELYTPEGKNFLKLPANNYGYASMKSSPATALPSQDYVFSVYMNTSALSAGQAIAAIQQLNTSGSVVKSDYATVDSLKGWEFKMKKFTTTASTDAVQIILYTSGSGSSSAPYGYAYFDDVKIRPALEVSDLTPNSSSDDNYWDVGQTCRLYPETDSLSCDYYKGATSITDKGVRYKGWLGHCLEYDRYPGSSEACLLWWPVPHTTNKVNEWCGDNKVTGDEDCECVSNLNSDPAQINLSCSLLGVEASNVWGTNVGHQYECKNCIFTEGWCGDNVLQKNMGEECDWNEATKTDSKQDANLGDPKRNLNAGHFSCAYDPSEEPDQAPYVVINGQTQQKQYDSSRKGKYLFAKASASGPADLGCYSIGSGNDANGNPLQCTFNFANCSEYFGYESTPGHTRQQCIEAGGVVVNNLGEVVIDQPSDKTKDPGGIIISPNVSKDSDNSGVDDYYPYMCKFNVSSCSFVFGGGGGWQQLENWSETSSATGSGVQTSCGGMGCGGATNCTTGYHAFSNTATETCAYTDEVIDSNKLTGQLCDCNTDDNIAYANVVSVGCY